MPDPIQDPNNVILTGPIELPLPTKPAVPWIDPEGHWHLAEVTIVGHQVTYADNEQIIFAADGVAGAKPDTESDEPEPKGTPKKKSAKS